MIAAGLNTYITVHTGVTGMKLRGGEGASFSTKELLEFILKQNRENTGPTLGNRRVGRVQMDTLQIHC